MRGIKTKRLSMLIQDRIIPLSLLGRIERGVIVDQLGDVLADLFPIRTCGSEPQEGVGDRAGARRSGAPGDELELVGIVRLGVGGHRPESDPPYADRGARCHGEHGDSIEDEGLGSR